MPNPAGSRLAANVYAYRVARGWTTYRLAKEAGLSTIYVDKIERGVVHDPAPESLDHLARALGVTVPDLLNDAPAVGRNPTAPDNLPIARRLVPLVARMQIGDVPGFLRCFAALPPPEQQAFAALIRRAAYRTEKDGKEECW